MDREQLLEFHKKMTEQARDLMVRKNTDYAGHKLSEMSVFGNLEMVERMGIVNTETGILLRMLDKFARLKTFVQDGSLLVKDESVTDTLIDLINYSVLMAAKIETRKADK